MKERIKWPDIAKGIGMVLIIIGHSIPGVRTPLTNQIVSIIYSVHVPLFFVISGYFFRSTTSIQLAKKNTKSLLVPYFVTSLFLITGNYLTNHFPIEFIKSAGATREVLLAALYGSGTRYQLPFYDYVIPSIGAIWFLLAMFFGNQFFNASLNFARRKKEYLYFLPVFLTILGFVISRIIVLPWSINSALFAQVFYLSGYLLKQKSIKLNQPILVGLGLVLWRAASLSDTLYLVNVTVKYPIVAIAGAVGSSYVLLSLSLFISRNRLSEPLRKFGKYSLIALCIHLIDLNLFIWDRYFYNGSNFIGVALYRLSIVVFLMAIFIYIKKMIIRIKRKSNA